MTIPVTRLYCHRDNERLLDSGRRRKSISVCEFCASLHVHPRFLLDQNSLLGTIAPRKLDRAPEGPPQARGAGYRSCFELKYFSINFAYSRIETIALFF